MNGLVIKSPSIERILQASRIWAVRGTRTRASGRIALVKRSGQIVGTCSVMDCIGPMTPEELRADAAPQQVPVEMLMSSPGAKAFAWVLSDVKALAEPIPYTPATGAMMWVKLTPENVPNRYNELEGQAQPAPQLELTITPVVAELQAQPEPSPQPESACEEQAEAA